MNGVKVVLVICLGSLVVGRNVEYKYEKSEYHHDDSNGDGYIMVDGYHPEGEESYYYDDSGSTADSQYHYPEEDSHYQEQEEYHIEYDPKHHGSDHHVNQYEHHYIQEESEHNGQKLVKTDYDYEKRSNQVVIQSEEIPTSVAHEHEHEPDKKPNTPSKRVHIKLPEYDYSSYSKTDSETKYDKPVEKYDSKPKKEMKKYNKMGKHQYMQKAMPQPRYDHIQRIPNDYVRGREVVRQRVKVRPQRPTHQKIQTLPEIVVADDHNRNEDGKRPRGKPRRIPVRHSEEEEGKDHVLYYVDQPVQVYDPQEKKFHQFDRLSEKEAEEIKKETKERAEYKEKD
ncbi:hypothetical protein ACFFRR_003391 [Megaselia abdita]